MNELLLILIGGPVLMGGPPVLAVLLCERHANQSAAAIRRQYGTDLNEAPARRPSPHPRPALPARTTEVAR